MEEETKLREPDIKAELTVEITDLGDDEDEKKVKRLFKRLRIYGLIALVCFIAGAICLRTKHYELGSYFVMAIVGCFVLACGVVGKLLGKANGPMPWYGGL